MRRLTRSLLGSILAVAVAASVAGGVRAQESTGRDTAAVAVNRQDGRTVFRLAFQIIQTDADVVDNVNIALAWASCENCTTIAASFQVVLVTGNPSVVTPQNYAIAINFECFDCQTLAAAYQWVLSTGGPVHFTPEGRQAIAEIRQGLHDLMQGAEGLTLDEILAELDALALQLAEVLANELVASGPPGLDLEVTEEDEDEGVEPGESTETPIPIDTGSPTPGDTGSAPEPTSPAPETTSPTPSPTATP